MFLGIINNERVTVFSLRLVHTLCLAQINILIKLMLLVWTNSSDVLYILQKGIFSSQSGKQFAWSS